MIINSIIAGAGGGDNTYYVGNLSAIGQDRTYTNDVTFDCKKSTVTQSTGVTAAFAFYHASGKKLTIKTDSIPSSFERAFRQANFDEIDISGVAGFPQSQNGVAYNYMFDGCPTPIITGEIDLSGMGRMQASFIGYNTMRISEIRFKANSFSSWGYATAEFAAENTLSDDSVISFANALNESATGITLHLGVTALKNRFYTIMGTVGMDATNTYHVFTKSASGTVSLADFVTNTKGWTLS